MARPVRMEYAGTLYSCEARDLAMCLAGRYCRAVTSRSALAREVEMSLSGFVHACERVHRHLTVRRHPLPARLKTVLTRVGDAVT